MDAAIDVLRAEGAEVSFLSSPFPAQLGTCVSYPPPAGCSTVLLYGQKRDLNAYLAATPGAPNQTIAMAPRPDGLQSGFDPFDIGIGTVRAPQA